jgi:hypothetical protein
LYHKLSLNDEKHYGVMFKFFIISKYSGRRPRVKYPENVYYWLLYINYNRNIFCGNEKCVVREEQVLSYELLAVNEIVTIL